MYHTHYHIHVLLKRGLKWPDIYWSYAVAQTPHKSHRVVTMDTSYLELTSEQWGVHFYDFHVNWQHYNGTAIFIYIDNVCCSTMSKIDRRSHCKLTKAWWHHGLDTFATLLVIVAGDPPLAGGVAHKGAVMCRFDVCCQITWAFWPTVEKSVTLRRYAPSL